MVKSDCRRVGLKVRLRDVVIVSHSVVLLKFRPWSIIFFREFSDQAISPFSQYRWLLVSVDFMLHCWYCTSIVLVFVLHHSRPVYDQITHRCNENQDNDREQDGSPKNKAILHLAGESTNRNLHDDA